MTLGELAAFEKKLKKQGDMIFPNAATEEQISSFEKEYNIRLPEKYREWLLFHDGGEFYLPGGVQMYGVAHKPVIDVNYDDKPSKNHDRYIVIGAMATGDPILCEKTGEQVSIYNHEEDRIENDEIFPDFYAFIDALFSILEIGG